MLSTHPDQLRLLRTDFAAHIDGAIDEVARYACPVPYMPRTATVDTEQEEAELFS
ncbi:cytochrome P450 [Rhodococcus ruber BKS 20-38]|uniref:Cytochrome P450 n=1 Tax=Rhodococcus ruber BKS 20-38 TaxID=1278076 RepID=M2ZIB2_9NOCA|nr:hypothetical protein [Rhodococcus ruber]EME67052.1 cytochrome P450 [Rhodococcus ruber BKS 20-38]